MRSARLTEISVIDKKLRQRRCGRVAEGGGLLNRYTLSRRIMGSNPILSASRYVRARAESA